MAFVVPGDEAYDPCTVYIELRNARLEVLKGASVKRNRFRNGDDERETEWSTVNLEKLEAAMAAAKRECMEKELGRPARSAIGIGYPAPLVRGPYDV